MKPDRILHSIPTMLVLAGLLLGGCAPLPAPTTPPTFTPIPPRPTFEMPATWTPEPSPTETIYATQTRAPTSTQLPTRTPAPSITARPTMNPTRGSAADIDQALVIPAGITGTKEVVPLPDPSWPETAGAGFSLRYPPTLTLEKTGGAIHLLHQVPYRHANPCSGTTSRDLFLDELTDFDLSFRLYTRGLTETITSTLQPLGPLAHVYVGTTPAYVAFPDGDPCNLTVYFVTLGIDRTLRVERQSAPEFDALFAQELADLPDVILPEEEAALFKRILASIRLR